MRRGRLMVVTQLILPKDLPTKCQQVDFNNRRPKPHSQDRDIPVVQAPLEEGAVAVLLHMEAEITLGTL
jgi:hypothetical protein